MQRLFTAFPAGAPGAGLLLLRGAAGLAAIADCSRILSSGAVPGAWAAVLLLCGMLVMIGMLTPIASVTLAAVQGGLMFAPGASGEWLARREVLAIAIAFALMLLGPGWLSFDAYLFGRRRIVIPDAPKA